LYKVLVVHDGSSRLRAPPAAGRAQYLSTFGWGD
jgi:hypothetical protein